MVPIDFNGDDALGRKSQLARQRTGAGPDFNNSIFRCDAGETNDALKDMTVGKKVLAEALLQMNVPYGIRTRVTALKGPCPGPG